MRKLLLYLSLHFCGCIGAYFADWSAVTQEHEDARALCVDIPRNLSLCADIGYTKMRLPNLLDHDTMAEVAQQASSWVPLINIKCAADSQLFLCSLFAPVCFEPPIYPCRSLCHKVKSGCEATMANYGFPWPEMLDCAKFPVDNDMCIAPMAAAAETAQKHPKRHRQQEAAKGVSSSCGAKTCNQANTYENILDNFCQADFVLKMKFRRARGRNLLGRKVNPVFKTWLGTPGELRRLRKPRLTLAPEDECCSDWISRNNNGRFLVMGKRQGQELVANFLLPWTKSKELKRARRMFKKIDCSNLAQTSQRLVMADAFTAAKNLYRGGRGGGGGSGGDGGGGGHRRRRRNEEKRRRRNRRRHQKSKAAF